MFRTCTSYRRTTITQTGALLPRKFKYGQYEMVPGTELNTPSRKQSARSAAYCGVRLEGVNDENHCCFWFVACCFWTNLISSSSQAQLSMSLCSIHSDFPLVPVDANVRSSTFHDQLVSPRVSIFFESMSDPLVVSEKNWQFTVTRSGPLEHLWTLTSQFSLFINLNYSPSWPIVLQKADQVESAQTKEAFSIKLLLLFKSNIAWIFLNPSSTGMLSPGPQLAALYFIIFSFTSRDAKYVFAQTITCTITRFGMSFTRMNCHTRV